MPASLTRALSTAAAVAALAAAALVAAPAAVAAPCSDVELVVARGTGEPGTLGIIVGDPLLYDTKQALPGRNVTAYAVNYPASFDAGSPRAGTIDVVAHVTAQAAACPGQEFVLVGYSQGAQVVDQAVGVDTTGTINGGPSPAVLPGGLAPRVSAVVTFGNPITSLGRGLPAPYDAGYEDFCRAGDPVCEAGGINILAHLLYIFDTKAAAAHIATRV